MSWLKKNWHIALGLGGCAVLGGIYNQYMLLFVVCVLSLLDLFAAWLLARQRILISDQHKIIVESMHGLLDTHTKLHVSEWNLSRATAELARHDISFTPLLPPNLKPPGKDELL